MPQDMTDLLQRCATTQHRGRQTMAQQMRANVFLRRFQPGLRKGLLQHVIDRLCVFERLVRRTMRDEQSARVAGSAMSNVVHDRLTHFTRQRHTLMPSALASNQDFARAPVGVLKLDRHHLGSTQPQSRQQQ